MVDPTLPLPGLSPIEGKEIVARFDGGRLSSDGGLLVLREIERRLKIAERLAACIDDPRDPGSTVHPLADIIRFRMLMIAAGYEDGNDADSLRADPLFKLALAMAVPVTGKRSGIARIDRRGIAIVAPAFVASSSQRRGQLLLDQLLNEIPDPIPNTRLERIRPTIPQKQRRLVCRRRAIRRHGVISSRRSNAGLEV